MNATALTLYPPDFVRAGRITLGLLAVLCASLLVGVYFATNPPLATTLDAMLLFACLIQAFSIGFQGQSLGRSISVLQVQRAPATLWREWLRQWLLSVTRYWAVLCACTSLLLATPVSHTYWLAAPALLSLLQSQSALAVLAHAGLLPRRVATVIQSALLALVLYVGIVAGFPAALAWFAALPVLVLVLCTLTWPALACWIMHAQADALYSVSGAQSNVLRRARDAIARWAGRFQPLHYSAPGTAQPTNRRTLLVLAIMQNFVFFSQLMPAEWGEQATSVRLSRLALICVLCSNAQLVHDLHWRTLLLPGGTQLRRLGTRIVLSTMLFQAPLVLVFAAGSALMSPPQTWGLGTLASMVVPLMELACCTVLMTLVRAFPRRVQVGAHMVLGIPLMYFPLWSIFKQDLPQLAWQIGPAYALLLATVTGAALFIANRRWTPARLLNALSTGLGK